MKFNILGDARIPSESWQRFFILGSGCSKHGRRRTGLGMVMNDEDCIKLASHSAWKCASEQDMPRHHSTHSVCSATGLLDMPRV